MEIRYIRKLMTSYMVIDRTEVPEEWEEKMIAHAAVENVLFADCICEDGRNDLWYDITGKQSLDVALEENGFGYDLLCQLLLGIYEAAEGIEGILLRAENLLLTPESIFWDYGEKRIYICYYPGNSTAAEEMFRQLMEYVLVKLDHADTQAVELAYEIYGQAAKQEWSLREIKTVVCLSYPMEEEQKEFLEMSNALQGTEDAQMKKARQTAAPFIPQGEEQQELELQTESVPEEKGVRRQSLGSFLKSVGEGVTWEKVQACIQRRVGIFAKQRRGKRRGKRRTQSAEWTEQERFVFEPEAEMEEAEPVSARPTVLLADLTKKPEGILRYEGSGMCENLTIEGEEFLIGSKRTCGGYIPSKTVSRVHARITCVDGIYFLEDLNSSNGTYAGGELLNYKTKVSLQKNEIIVFADEKFRFI